MAGLASDKFNKADLSPEEYVTSLYRTLLRRDPDDDGLKIYARALRAHGDYTRILRQFLESSEFRNVERGVGGHAPVYPKFSETDDGALNTQIIIESSRNHFSDLSFVQGIGARSNLQKRRKRKISTIGLYYPKMSNGGTERVSSRQCLAWTDLGYRVVLITDEPHDASKDYDYGNVERFVIPPKMMDNHDYRPRGRELARILSEQGVDVFVNNLWDETSTVWDVLVAKSLGIPVVIGWHNIFDTRIREAGDLHLANVRFSGYRYADLVTVLSTVDKLWFRSQDVTARVVYNPLTFDHLPAATAPLNGKTVVWVARAERHQKRLDLAIQMFPLVLARVPDAKLVIVGGGPDLEWAKEYARSLGISHNVEFTGYTTDVAKHLARSDVHLLTSEFEGWCLALGEAWAYGVPSVMFELPYLEYVQSGKGFIAVEMLNITAMADAVCALLTDAPLRKALGRGARAVAEEFDSVSVTEEWRKIFEDIENKDDLTEPLSENVELRGLRALTTVLSNRFLTLQTPRTDSYVPVLPSSVQAAGPRKRRTRYLVRTARIAIAPYVMTRRALRQVFVPDRRLKMIDLSHVGLGDNLMIWTGLFALLSNDVPICAPGCVLHVQPILAELASQLFARFGLVIQHGRPERQLSPIYTPLPPTGVKEWWGAYVGRDWRMNWVEALDKQKTFPRDGSDTSFAARMRLRISERLLYRRSSWAEATPGYIGYRVWLPLAASHGIYPVIFLSQIKRALPAMRLIISNYIDEMTPLEERSHFTGNAAFPTGKSFQTLSPKFYKQVNDALGGEFFTCYVQRDSPWFIDYEQAAVKTVSLSDLKDTFRIIKYAGHLLTTDSFTSHLAQLLRDDFVLVLSRDMEESIVHPAAKPNIMANYPACAPCNYQERYHFKRCVAGYEHCIAFENSAFAISIAARFRR